jgi:hypothetical protein
MDSEHNIELFYAVDRLKNEIKELGSIYRNKDINIILIK